MGTPPADNAMRIENQTSWSLTRGSWLKLIIKQEALVELIALYISRSEAVRDDLLHSQQTIRRRIGLLFFFAD